MDYLDPNTTENAVDLGGGKFGFQDCDTGVRGTDVKSDFLNSVLLEILNVIEAAGITPDSGNMGQLLQAISVLTGTGVTLNSSDNSIDITPDLVNNQILDLQVDEAEVSNQLLALSTFTDAIIALIIAADIPSNATFVTQLLGSAFMTALDDKFFFGSTRSIDHGGAGITLPAGGTWRVMAVAMGSDDTIGFLTGGNFSGGWWDNADRNHGGVFIGSTVAGGTVFNADLMGTTRGVMQTVFAYREG